jgi:hypothetical protein
MAKFPAIGIYTTKAHRNQWIVSPEEESAKDNKIKIIYNFILIELKINLNVYNLIKCETCGDYRLK